MRIWIFSAIASSSYWSRQAHSRNAGAPNRPLRTGPMRLPSLACRCQPGLKTMLPDIRNYDALYREFQWPKLARYNIGVDVCDRWAAAEPGRLAIIHVRADGGTEEI